MNYKSTISTIIPLIFVCLFLYTGVSKLSHTTIFKEALSENTWLAPLAGIIAFLIPKLEIATVIFLLVPHLRLLGLYMSLFMMIIFTIYIAYLLLFSTDVPCSCGGIITNLTIKQHLYLNISLCILARIGISLNKRINRDKPLRLKALMG